MALLETPRTPEGWDRYAFHNRLEIDRINLAIRAQYKTDLPSYPLDPINLAEPTTWLSYNSQAHIAFNGVLGLQTNDLLDVDIRNPRQLQAWSWLNYSETRDAQAKLQI